ncbi:hypothetical protein HCN44_005548 [Aphidius gifuensis]|uniref:Odorant receptor n=1 Tax=Aphidius gifuensis TaxID=684658 RepID=A0A834Y264_APHGI|nr:hypothetical protein HCN44_005548 [Aphidius gifuensis]
MELDKKMNNVKWNKDTEYALGLHKKLINFLGYWPTEYQKLAKIRVIIISVILIAVVIIFIRNLILYGNCGTDEEFIDTLIIMTANLMSTIKVILCWHHKNHYNNILQSIIEDWYCVNDNKTRKIMLKYAKIGRNILIFQLIGSYGTLIPMFVRYPSTDEVVSKYNNETILLRDIPSIFMFTIAMHVCGQLDILYNTIQIINGDENYQQQHFYIENFIKRHNHLLEILNKFETICSVIFFCEILSNIFIICISGIMMLRALQHFDNVLAFKMFARMFVLLLQLFLYNLIGEILSNKTENLQIAIYNCNWYKLTPCTIKNIAFIILRTNYPFHLTAGKIQYMNLSNFKNTVKSIVSFLSILLIHSKTMVLDNKTKWNENTEYAFGLQKKLITFLGYWPEYFDDKLSKTKAIIWSTTQLFVVIIFINNFNIHGNCGTAEELIDSLTMMTTSSLSILKILLSWCQRNLYKIILNSLIKDWYYSHNNESREIMLKYAKIGRVILIVQFFGAYGSLIPLIARYPSTNQIINEYNNDSIFVRNIPYGPRCWISMTMPLYIYVGYYLILCIHITIMATAYIGVGIFMFTIAMHVCGQLDILYSTIKMIDADENYQQQHFYLKNFIKRHNHLLENLNKFETICSVIFFCEILSNIFIICLSGIMMLRALQHFDNVLAFKMFARMFVLLLQLFLYNLIGEILSNKTENLQIAIYNSEELIDALTMMATNTLAILKILLTWYQRKLYKIILNSFIDDWYFNHNDKSHKIMLKYAKIGRVVLIIQCFGAYGSLIPLIARYPSTNQMINKYNNDSIFVRNIPYGPRCWISLTMSWYLYVGYYLMFCVNVIIMVTAYMGVGIFMFTIAMHVCGQLDILYNTIKIINGAENYQQQHFYLKNFIKRHNHLLENLNKFETICSVIFFCEILSNIFIICLSGIMMLRALQNFDNVLAFKMFARMFVLLLQLFLYNLIGEILSNKTENLQIAIYNCNWYKLTPCTIRNIAFIILRTNYPFHLTAGKIHYMNLSNFKNTVKSIVSFLSILRLMFES